jgi:hypothetical protein
MAAVGNSPMIALPHLASVEIVDLFTSEARPKLVSISTVLHV